MKRGMKMLVVLLSILGLIAVFYFILFLTA